MSTQFNGCTELEYLNIQPRTLGYNKNGGANINNMFYGCNKLLTGKIITKDKNIREAINIYKKKYISNTYLDTDCNLW